MACKFVNAFTHQPFDPLLLKPLEDCPFSHLQIKPAPSSSSSNQGHGGSGLDVASGGPDRPHQRPRPGRRRHRPLHGLRAVCHTWRSATADPKASPCDPRFLPRLWAVLDEVHQSDARLFVNVATGRFVRKDLPLLRRYHFVAGAGGSLIVLAEKSDPHTARVLNPFTGSLISFKAPVPPELQSRAIYCADAEDESFYVLSLNKKEEQGTHPLVWMAVAGGIYAASRERGSFGSHLVPATNNILGLVSKVFSDYFPKRGNPAVIRCYFLVESQGEIFVVFKLRHGAMEVFKINTAANVLEPVKDIGSRALFVGDYRCLSVDAEKFTSLDANCIYYVDEAEKPMTSA
ncbi:hypothetical protein PR202_gb27563 [Eleusine coracana subsp. coracana]|uniref:KIB1-4 beta-propeller domain-containing protein n=1 Tax=Eleusine coracana subsp. coracana TaxID=191504 RepID=A0AAV5FUS7_ELECO|nr:hypothetical protein PR202_gb27563 [Eleusine coracana subsp. coracana]